MNPASPEKMELKKYLPLLKPRARDWHKGLSGHVLIIGGNRGYAGAPRMAAEAALRVGAGLVSVATHPDNAAMMTVTRPEIMCHAIHDANQLTPLLHKATFLIIGPGLGQDAWAKNLFELACKQTLPSLVDADGLNLLASSPQKKDNWVLTPHPEEAARLLQEYTQIVQKDRITALKRIHEKYGGVSVLKGAGTLVMGADAMPAICEKGNPGMATAGMGDVLSGVIGGLAAQGITLQEAAKLGVLIHAMAGDLAAKEGERGVLSLDLMPYLRQLVNSAR